MQVMAHTLGGEVTRTGKSEFGKSNSSVLKELVLFDDLPSTQTCWMSHRDSVTRPVAGIRSHRQHGQFIGRGHGEHRDHGLYGIQYHPEVVHTPYGTDITQEFSV